MWISKREDTTFADTKKPEVKRLLGCSGLSLLPPASYDVIKSFGKSKAIYQMPIPTRFRL